VAKLMAPIAPFYADWLYQQLDGCTGLEKIDSVHLAHFPEVEQAAIDEGLNQRMDYAQRISSLVLSLRKKQGIRVRQPLQKILLPISSTEFKLHVQAVEGIILQEVNVREIDYVEDASGVIRKRAKPNFRNLGRRLGADMKVANQKIQGLSDQDIRAFEDEGEMTLQIEDRDYTLGTDDIEIISEDIPGWQVASSGSLTVALDITITDELADEGMARELIHALQALRKEADLEVTDRIRVLISEHPQVVRAVEAHGEMIAREVLADDIQVEEEVNGSELVLADTADVQASIARA
jgi:isoleucyl-tRNA synthetase